MARSSSGSEWNKMMMIHANLSKILKHKLRLHHRRPGPQSPARTLSSRVARPPKVHQKFKLAKRRRVHLAINFSRHHRLVSACHRLGARRRSLPKPIARQKNIKLQFCWRKPPLRTNLPYMTFSGLVSQKKMRRFLWHLDEANAPLSTKNSRRS